jgi:RNA recognition motif-containing protein
MNIYVGNIPFSTTESELRDIFTEYGEVHTVKIITDRETGRSRGFGFVEMSENIARKAIAELNGSEYEGKQLTVNEAKPKNTDYSSRDRRKSW